VLICQERETRRGKSFWIIHGADVAADWVNSIAISLIVSSFAVCFGEIFGAFFGIFES
jgi:ABC-type dipeptide/oligopeptide/nickel transport system permease subunit